MGGVRRVTSVRSPSTLGAMLGPNTEGSIRASLSSASSASTSSTSSGGVAPSGAAAGGSASLRVPYMRVFEGPGSAGGRAPGNGGGVGRRTGGASRGAPVEGGAPADPGCVFDTPGGGGVLPEPSPSLVLPHAPMRGGRMRGGAMAPGPGLGGAAGMAGAAGAAPSGSASGDECPINVFAGRPPPAEPVSLSRREPSFSSATSRMLSEEPRAIPKWGPPAWRGTGFVDSPRRVYNLVACVESPAPSGAGNVVC